MPYPARWHAATRSAQLDHRSRERGSSRHTGQDIAASEGFASFTASGVSGSRAVVMYVSQINSGILLI